MRIHWHSKYQDFEKANKRHSWIATAIIGTAAIGGGVALYEGSQNRDAAKTAQDQYNAQPDYKQLPGYAESDAARGNWWSTLQDWQKQPGYGVVQQDYEDIYNKAAQKINQYYWGGPSGQPGLQDKISASAARRGVAESPSLDVMKQRTGAQEAYDLGQKSTEVNSLKAAANEQGRTNWLASLQNLSSLKPAFVSGKTGQFGITPESSGMSNLFGTAASGVQSYYQNQQNQDYQMKLYDKYFGAGAQPSVTQSSLTDSTGTEGFASGLDYWNNPGGN
jgi:hypothetical protein